MQSAAFKRELLLQADRAYVEVLDVEAVPYRPGAMALASRMPVKLQAASAAGAASGSGASTHAGSAFTA